jgi:hypothetical protein
MARTEASSSTMSTRVGSSMRGILRDTRALHNCNTGGDN